MVGTVTHAIGWNKHTNMKKLPKKMRWFLRYLLRGFLNTSKSFNVISRRKVISFSLVIILTQGRHYPAAGMRAALVSNGRFGCSPNHLKTIG